MDNIKYKINNKKLNNDTIYKKSSIDNKFYL